MSIENQFLHLPKSDLDEVLDHVGDRWEKLRNQRIFLTGGTGFIGKWLLGTFLYANKRLQLNAKVILLSRNPHSFQKDFPELTEISDVEWVKGDVRNFNFSDVGNFKFAIHAATDVVATTSPLDVLETCTIGTQRVFTAAKLAGCNRALLLSSGAVYGQQPPNMEFLDEKWVGAPNTLLPSSAYGEGKRVSELSAIIAAAPDIEVAIARCFAFIGPHLPLDKHFAIGNFIGAALQNKDIHIKGDGTPLRSYLYMSELTEWLWILLFDAPHGRAYNVGGNESISIRDLALKIKNELSASSKVIISQTPKAGHMINAYIPSIKLIAKDLNLTPKVNLSEAIMRTAEWSKQYSIIK